MRWLNLKNKLSDQLLDECLYLWHSCYNIYFVWSWKLNYVLITLIPDGSFNNFACIDLLGYCGLLKNFFKNWSLYVVELFPLTFQFWSLNLPTTFRFYILIMLLFSWKRNGDEREWLILWNLDAEMFWTYNWYHIQICLFNSY